MGCCAIYDASFSFRVMQRVNPILDQHHGPEKRELEKYFARDLKEKEEAIKGYSFTYNDDNVEKCVREYITLINEKLGGNHPVDYQEDNKEDNKKDDEKKDEDKKDEDKKDDDKKDNE